MNLPGGWIIATLASICGAIWIIAVYYLMKKPDKIFGLACGILGPMLLILGLSPLFQPLPWGWWVIPGLLAFIFFYLLTRFTERGRLYKVMLLQVVEKDVGKLESYTLAFFLESVLIASIILIPLVIVSLLRGFGSVIIFIFSIIGFSDLNELVELFQRATDLVLSVLLLSSVIIAFLEGVNITKRIWESRLYSYDMRPIDGVILGISISIFPSLKLLVILAVLLILPLFVFTIGMSSQNDFIISLPGIWGIMEYLLTLWLFQMTTLGVFLTLQAIVVGGMVGGHRSIAELSRRQNQLDLDDQMSELFGHGNQS